MVRHHRVIALPAEDKSTAFLFGRLRERHEVAAFFEGLEIVEPGLTQVAAWRAEVPAGLTDSKVFEHGGVARKPA